VTTTTTTHGIKKIKKHQPLNENNLLIVTSGMEEIKLGM